MPIPRAVEVGSATRSGSGWRRGRGGVRRTGVGAALADRALCGSGAEEQRDRREASDHARDGGEVALAVAGDRLDGLVDEPRPGRPRKIGDAQVEEVIFGLSRPRPATRRAGLRARWPARSGCRRRRCRESGGRSGCSRTAPRRGSSRAIRSSSTRCATSSGSISTRPSARWCCVSTSSLRSRRSIAARRCCRCCRARPSARRTTTSARAPRVSTPRSTSARAG